MALMEKNVQNVNKSATLTVLQIFYLCNLRDTFSSRLHTFPLRPMKFCRCLITCSPIVPWLQQEYFEYHHVKLNVQFNITVMQMK